MASPGLHLANRPSDTFAAPTDKSNGEDTILPVISSSPEIPLVLSPSPSLLTSPLESPPKSMQDSGSVPNATSIPASSSKGESNLSGGAVAGVAIAALIIGAVLAFIVAFFLFKRRNKSQNEAVAYNNYTDSTPELIMMQKTAGRHSPYVQVSQTPLPAPATQAPIPAPQPNSSDIIASILPAAANEEEIQARVVALFQQVHRHVELYYRDVHASITPSMEPELARFGTKGVNMAEMLQDCSSPTTAIKHALVAYVLGITSPNTIDEGETLFPEDLTSIRLHNALASDSNFVTAQTLHRRLSVFLYTASNAHSASRRSWSSQSEFREAAEHFSLTFFSWTNPAADDQEKEDDLTRIISEVLEMRIWLFGQPDGFEFQWDGVGNRGVVVSPELVRLDGDARGGRSKVVLETKVVSI
ncbi:hypothetical protein GQ44DRAFT_715029 [Phaeosphaeriaceae sp. PMI808]|nr:hypothetical protein GQ44DRAFT_715029 [Phaeosphaeriaceae sp. PMI808]